MVLNFSQSWPARTSVTCLDQTALLWWNWAKSGILGPHSATRTPGFSLIHLKAGDKNIAKFLLSAAADYWGEGMLLGF